MRCSSLSSSRAAALAKAGGVIAACAAVAAVPLDLRMGTFRQPVTGTPLLISAAVAAVALLLLPRLSAAGVARAACGAGAVSLGCSFTLRLRSDGAGDLGPAASSAYGAFEPVALLLVLLISARRATPVGAALGVPLLTAAVVLRPLAIRVQEGSTTVALFLALLTGAALAAGLTARLVVAAREQRDERIRLDQRVDFARDLHDFVAHHVTGIVVQAQGARAVAEKNPELVEPALELIERTGAEALESMRRMVGALREEAGGGAGAGAGVPLPVDSGLDGVRSLVDGFAYPGARIRLVERGPLDGIPAEVASSIHRVVMEALTNVARHSHGCGTVEVLLTAAPGGVVDVEIRDDGAGRRVPGGGSGRSGNGYGYGLRGLRERVALAGGTFRAGPGGGDGGGGDDGDGWTVAASFPGASAAFHGDAGDGRAAGLRTERGGTG
ncbi:sensor histidine kinase [Streptomyces enissocaesilis]|uniref:histidine kinase n=1 Tax=Streptomyces enissocaesilis TaxID=332589 RepID=A0ABP6JPE1_9ACTN